MHEDYKTIPTPELVARWERFRNGLRNLPPDERTVGDYEVLYEMKREIDRRRDEPKPTVDINFSKDYLTD